MKLFLFLMFETDSPLTSVGINIILGWNNTGGIEIWKWVVAAVESIDTWLWINEAWSIL